MSDEEPRLRDGGGLRHRRVGQEFERPERGLGTDAETYFDAKGVSWTAWVVDKAGRRRSTAWTEPV